MVRRSLEDQKTHLEARLARVNEKLAIQAISERVKKGSIVTFQHPIGSTSPPLKGVVVEVKEVTTGLWVKVDVTDGAEPQVISIRAKQILTLDGKKPT